MLNKLKLKQAVSIIDEQIKEQEDELSFLRAAKRNLETLIEGPKAQLPKKEEEV